MTSMQLPDETFYVSDTQIFTSGYHIGFRGMGEQLDHDITPSDLNCSHSRYIITIPSQDSLFFCGSGDLYSCTFSGTSLQNVTPNNDKDLINPSLSNCGNYITMVSPGFIHRFNRTSRELVEFPIWREAQYALYNSLQDKFYVFADDNLYVLDEMGTTPILLMKAEGINSFFSVSPNLRYFAFYGVWTSYGFLAQVYDCEEQRIIEIANCYTLCFSPTESKLFYSSKRHGLSDLRSYDLYTGNDVLLTDGINPDNWFLDDISNIFVRSDGDKILFSAHTQKHTNDL